MGKGHGEKTEPLTKHDPPPHPCQAVSSGDGDHATGISILARDAMARLCAGRRLKKPSGGSAPPMGPPDPTALARALCDKDDGLAVALVEDLLDAGLSVEEVCLDHLAPAARKLGEWWADDSLSFIEVTIGAARIQSLMRRMPGRDDTAPPAGATGAVFAAAPGEEHTLGIIMAADLLRRAGWDIGLIVDRAHDDALARLIRDDRPVIGLSCSGDRSFPALKRLMTALRESRPGARILVGGEIARDAGRLAELPPPFIPVRDVVEAEIAMTEIAASSPARPAPPPARAVRD